MYSLELGTFMYKYSINDLYVHLEPLTVFEEMKIVTLVLIIANLRASLLKKTQDAEVAFQNE